MDAVTLINEHLNIERLLEHYDFDKVKTEGEIIRACCKLHGGNNPTAFAISRDTGLWFCHTGNCGGGDVYTLVQRMESIDFPSAVRWLAKFYDVDITKLQIMERKADYLNDLKRFIKMMKKNKPKQLSEFTIEERIQPVAKYRNFKEETLDYFGLGYVESVTLKKRNGEIYTLKHRLVFPIKFKGIQVGLSFRRIRSTDYPRWSHQPAHIETGEILYNYDSINSESVVLCEGISDVWAFHEIGVTAVATFGAHITEHQYKLILKSGVANIILAYDGDEAGRETTKKAQLMFKYKANLSMVRFDEGQDPESISREELKKRYEQRKKLP